MRTFAMVAISLLAIGAIVEGAVIVRLSGRVEALSQRLASNSDPSPTGATGPARIAAARAPAGTPTAGLAPSTLPRLLPTTPEPAAPMATSVLREALETSEGRQHLKAAIDLLREQERQEKLSSRAERAVEREQQHAQQLTRVLGLSSDEQGKVGQLYATMQANRRRVLDEMRAGQKDADQADDEIDNLRDETERSVRALLGEPRMQKYRESMRAQRRRDRGNDGQAPAAGAPPVGGAPATPPAPAP
jgi:hypothetical protein